jgi:hypothetical protein
MTLIELAEHLETYNFECEGGPLKNCVDWKKIKAALREASAVAAPLDPRLSWRLGCMADALVSAKVGPQARFFSRERVDELVLLLREAENELVRLKS